MAAPAFADYAITQSVVAGGGGTGSAGTYAVSGTAGQPASGTSSGATYSVLGGFWASATAIVAGPNTIIVNLVLNGTGSGSVASTAPGINCAPTCSSTFSNVASVTLNATPADANSVFTGWLGACTGRGPCVLGTSGTANLTGTFAPNSPFSLRLDVDENNSYDALTDGLLIIRYLFGLSGAPLINGAIGGGAALVTPALVAEHLGDIRPLLDIDGNGQADALTDGLLVLRYLFGLRGNALIGGVVGPGATRTTAPAIEAYFATILP